MSTAVAAIPLVGMEEGDEAGSPTAMRSLGLLATSADAPDLDRRMEDWIASQIDVDPDAKGASTPRTIWHQLIDRLPMARAGASKSTARGGVETAFADWSRFRVAYRRGVTVVRLVDPSLVKETNVRALTRDLIELIEAGNHRLILNFRGVEKVGSWVALAIDEIARRARAGEGGALKLCGLRDDLASVLALAGMAPGIALHPDEEAALTSAWPESRTPRTLPIDILLAVAAGPDVPPIRGGAPSHSLVDDETRRAARPRTTVHRTAEPGSGLWLIVGMGARKARTIPVVGDRFVIGRHRECSLRLGSPMVSKRHATIERRDGRIVLADLGSTNGTVINGRLLRGKETEIHDGDRIQIGPIVCTVATAAHRDGPIKVEGQVAEWLHGEDPRQDAINALDTAVLATSQPDATADESEWNIRTEIIQDVLVVTPETGELESDATIDRLRTHLHSLLEESVPRRVVINLEYVAHVSGQAIGVLLAHHLRLDATGGSLRIGQVRARIMAVLHQVRLTMLIECHPTLDEAVLSAWPVPTR